MIYALLCVFLFYVF